MAHYVQTNKLTTTSNANQNFKGGSLRNLFSIQATFGQCYMGNTEIEILIKHIMITQFKDLQVDQEYACMDLLGNDMSHRGS